MPSYRKTRRADEDLKEIYHIPSDLVVERARRSLKASRREDLQIEEPVCGG